MDLLSLYERSVPAKLRQPRDLRIPKGFVYDALHFHLSCVISSAIKHELFSEDMHLDRLTKILVKSRRDCDDVIVCTSPHVYLFLKPESALLKANMGVKQDLWNVSFMRTFANYTIYVRVDWLQV